jgi:uncharacterized membrane protein YgdD (TMEM256/DUF423 family)
MERKQILGILGILAVAIGAFGAHGMKPMLLANTPDTYDQTLHAYETGVYYHFFHLAAMMYCIIKLEKDNSKNIALAFGFFVAGIICFSGSLYGIAWARALGSDLSFLGPITPIGGVLFMIGWFFLMKSEKKIISPKQ